MFRLFIISKKAYRPQKIVDNKTNHNYFIVYFFKTLKEKGLLNVIKKTSFLVFPNASSYGGNTFISYAINVWWGALC